MMMNKDYQILIIFGTNIFDKGGATLGAGRDMSPPLLRDVPRRGYNPIYVVHLRGTKASR